MFSYACASVHAMRLVCNAMISSRDARSASSSTGPLPLALSSAPACIDPCLLLLNVRDPSAGNCAGVAAEFRDHDIAGSDADVINARSPGPRDFPSGRDKAIAHLAWPDEGDVAL